MKESKAVEKVTKKMKVKMQFNGNEGYGPDQVEGTTLAELLEQVENAISEWGGETEVVLFQMNNRYGANYGTLAATWDGTLFDEED